MGRCIHLDKGFWRHPDIQNMSFRQKIIYLYLFTNDSVSISGIYSISLKTISDDTGIKDRELIEETIKSLKKKVGWDKENNTVFVKNRFRRNLGGRKDLLYRGVLAEKEKTKTFLWEEFKNIYLDELKKLEGIYKQKPIPEITNGKNDIFCEESNEDIKKIITIWNEKICNEQNKLNLVTKITVARRVKIIEQLERGIDYEKVFDMVLESDYLQGFLPNKHWRITFDWLFSDETHWRKVLEGNYSNRDKRAVNYHYKVGDMFYEHEWKALPKEIKQLYEWQILKSEDENGKECNCVKITKSKVG